MQFQGALIMPERKISFVFFEYVLICLIESLIV